MPRFFGRTALLCDDGGCRPRAGRGRHARVRGGGEAQGERRKKPVAAERLVAATKHGQPNVQARARW